jgi:hypothetical protein
VYTYPCLTYFMALTVLILILNFLKPRQESQPWLSLRIPLCAHCDTSSTRPPGDASSEAGGVVGTHAPIETALVKHTSFHIQT